MDDNDHARTLLDRVRAGDESAARELIRDLYPLVAKIVRGYHSRQAAEEDLAQMVFVKVFQKLHQYSGKAPMAHWVSRIAVNTCRNQLAFEKTRPELRQADLGPEEISLLENFATTRSDAAPDDAVAARDLVQKLLAMLKPVERLVIDMLYLQERGVADVQKLTGWTAATVKVRAFRARQKLRKYVGRLL